MMSASLRRQAERFSRAFSDLVRAYQFRDREEMCFHGLSVSQCYTLEAIDRRGPMTMGDLAADLYVKISTMTRIVDRLVSDGLATRVEDADDRRVCRVQLTRKGRSVVAKVRADLIAEHERVLRQIEPGGREAVIAAMSHLLAAFEERQQQRCDEPRARRRNRTRAG